MKNTSNTFVSYETEIGKFLETVFDSETLLFYGYPAGIKYSGFYNTVPPIIEGTVAQRTRSLFPKRTSFVFPSADEGVSENLILASGIPQVGKQEVLNVGYDTLGDKRDSQVIKEIERILGTSHASKLLMAQPFIGTEIPFALPPETTTFFNNKINLPEIIPLKNLPKRYKTVENGEALQNIKFSEFPFPCVLKVSNSSSGDGVRVLFNKGEATMAFDEFRKVPLPLFFEEYTEGKNICLQFVISKKGEWKILGYTDQQTSKTGAFMGGIINQQQLLLCQYKGAFNNLLSSIATKASEKERYGIGAIDIIITAGGILKVIDPNFRFNASTASLVATRRGFLGKNNAITFTGKFEESKLKEVQSLVNTKKLGIISLIRVPETTQFYGTFTLLFDQPETKGENAVNILRSGISSELLSILATQKGEFTS